LAAFGQIPVRKLFDYKQEFKTGLYNEFMMLAPVPKHELYIDFNLTAEEKKNWDGSGPTEKKIYELTRAFHSSLDNY